MQKTKQKTKAKTEEAPKPTPSSQYGTGAYKPLRSTVLECACGIKYIKTRPRQQACLKCMLGATRRSR